MISVLGFVYVPELMMVINTVLGIGFWDQARRRSTLANVNFNSAIVDIKPSKICMHGRADVGVVLRELESLWRVFNIDLAVISLSLKALC